MGRFDGSVALVTGASRGIGLGIAQRLVDEGARVCVTARRQDALDAAVESLGGPDHAMAVAGKADDLEHQRDTVARVVETFGSLDLLVNNTGINPVYGPLMQLDLGAARKIVEVNSIAALSWVQQVYAAWLGEHGGAVVNVASIAGLKPAPGIALYGASKAMLIHLTEELAVELGPSIRVNAVAPAVVKTAFATALYEGREEQVSAIYPLKRLGEPADVAGAVAYLLSADASWVTGQTLVLDGGLTLLGGV
ncbi:MAG: SDR family oxidoreductase [Lapillicoccus sp.]